MLSDYVVFVDESGDHSLESIDKAFPLFVLSFCVMQKSVYIDQLTPRIRKLKFNTFGHDMVVLHEYDIRKKHRAFSILSKDTREAFMNSLTTIIDEIDFKIFAVVIDKERHKKKYVAPEHPYHMAMQFGLERIYGYMKILGQHERRTHFVCEARGKAEDAQLELAFRRVCDGQNFTGNPMPFDIIISDKRTNCEGLQMADLTARPIGLSVLRPDQPNRAMEVLDKKFSRSGGRKMGIGLKVFP